MSLMPFLAITKFFMKHQLKRHISKYMVTSKKCICDQIQIRFITSSAVVKELIDTCVATLEGQWRSIVISCTKPIHRDSKHLLC